jgi:hypothetical protein
MKKLEGLGLGRIVIRVLIMKSFHYKNPIWWDNIRHKACPLRTDNEQVSRDD